MANDPAAEASAFLLDLAHGKYNQELETADKFLAAVGTVTPWALVVKRAMDTLVMINKVTAPLQVIPDGHGGYIPAHGQSYYNPSTGEFTGRKS